MDYERHIKKQQIQNELEQEALKHKEKLKWYGELPTWKTSSDPMPIASFGVVEQDKGANVVIEPQESVTYRPSTYYFDVSEVDIINDELCRLARNQRQSDEENDNYLLINAETVCEQLAKKDFEDIFERSYEECMKDNPEKTTEHFSDFYDYYYDILFSNRIKQDNNVSEEVSIQTILDSRRGR